MAITKYEQFDFLIDIVPREESKPHKKHVRRTRKERYDCIDHLFFRIITWAKFNILSRFLNQINLVLFNYLVGKFWLLVFRFFIENLSRWTNYSVIANDSITYGNDWSRFVWSIRSLFDGYLIDRMPANNMQFSLNRINFNHKLN